MNSFLSFGAVTSWSSWGVFVKKGAVEMERGHQTCDQVAREQANREVALFLPSCQQ